MVAASLILRVQERCADLLDVNKKPNFLPHSVMGLLVAILIVLLDQWTKKVAVDLLEFRQPEAVTLWFDWLLTYNTGAAFSFLADAGGWQRWFLSAVATILSVCIVVWLFRLAPHERYLVLPLGFILGGGVGNLMDRILLGYVVDFISLHYNGWYWPAFNLADSAITVGAGWWCVALVLSQPSTGEDTAVS